ncbi:hypothetical protein [Lacrimispora sp. JR3]|uniref:hypothetical protein n=1 Tax=Lacrimispora sinapis TaxID=3111456 RepID=UPI00374972A8
MKVYAPNKQYTGTSASVPFCNGVGETDNPHLLEWFRSHGYEVENLPEEPEADVKEEQPTTEAEDPGKEPGKETKRGKAAGQKAGE